MASLWLALCLPALADGPWREAPHPAAVPADQLALAGNACGPAALLNAFRFGSEAWHRASDALPGDTGREQLRSIVREYGMRPSQHLAGRPRWSRKGVNLADLCDIANEMTRGHYLPQVSQEVLFTTGRESQEKLLRRAHRRLETSLAKGLPPVISLRRYVLRQDTGKPPAWLVIDAHFVTLTAVPRKLDKRATSFPVRYIDPWGAKLREGAISIASRPVLAATAAGSPCLEALFPQADIGRRKVRRGETTAVIPAAVLGRW